MKRDKPLSKKTKRDKFPLESGRDDEPARKSAVKGEDNKKSNEQIATKNAPSDDEGHRKSAKKPKHKEKHLQEAPTKLENKEQGRRQNNQKIRKGHVSNVERSNNSNSEENDLTDECEEVNHGNDQIEEERALKSEEGPVKRERTRRHSLRECLHLHKAQAEVVRSIGFISFLKVDLKQIPGKFSKWLKFPVLAFDVYATLGVPLMGREIMEITKSSMGEEYDEVDAVWLKEWKLQKNSPEVTRISEFIPAEKDGGESFKRNLIIYLFILDKLITSVRHYKEKTKQQPLCSIISPKLPLHKPDGEAQIPGDTLVLDVSIIVKKEDHRWHLVLDQPNSIMKKDDSIPSYCLRLGLSQLDSQSLVPQTTSMPDPSTSRVNREISIKKSAENKLKEGDKPSSKKGEVRKQSIKIEKSTLQQTTSSKRQPKNLPLSYCSLYVIKLTKLDSELSQDELAISEYVFGKVDDVDDSKETLKVSSFKKRYQDFKMVMDKEFERCPWIKVKQVNLGMATVAAIMIARPLPNPRQQAIVYAIAVA
ncbi:hypothetical protein Cgig2_024123 [Carnegiea gigantea]|uniref:Uncharacterized protein n=1 Tax=Carnegiea gigantea TaxID=171969 RepID=A0A9Q1JUU1_9CARY|nr:hypothetical protein Cgig2_024123 [Carnegiea gigantea]